VGHCVYAAFKRVFFLIQGIKRLLTALPFQLLKLDLVLFLLLVIFINRCF
jgi:hypothetical protein